MMKMNRKALALLASVMLAASVAGCGNPAENNESAPKAGTAAGAGEEPTVTAAPTEEPAATAAPTEEPAATAAPTAEPAATAEPTEEPAAEPAAGIRALTPEDQAWIDAIYAAIPEYRAAGDELWMFFSQGGKPEGEQFEAVTERHAAAQNSLADAIGVSVGWDALSARLSPYAYAVDFEWRLTEEEAGGTWLLQTSDGRYLALLAGEDPNGMYMYLIDSDNPRTNYGFMSLWGIVTGEGMDELYKLEGTELGEELDKERWLSISFDK